MTKDEKKLLLVDLCARLPYGVMMSTPKGDGHLNSIDQTIFGTDYGVNVDQVKRDYFHEDEVKPYLRPMESMSDEEWKVFDALATDSLQDNLFNWLHARHIDYRELIEAGLALPAPEGMYKTD